MVPAVRKARIEVVWLDGIRSASDMPGTIVELGIEQEFDTSVKSVIAKVSCRMQGIQSLAGRICVTR